MKVQQLRDMTEDELRSEVQELKRALFNLRLQKAIGQLEKPNKLRETKRSIARALTVLEERASSDSEEAH
ncbi:MAG: 50S ribosomal protein L29 [Acidobacteriota bacterium]|nr:50S ribosomal protein L29 [Acidobacteriota bacterium]